MTSAQRFDYAAYRRAFRLECARRGIDPVEGANSYQVVHSIANARRRAWVADQWWQRYELWFYCPPYRSKTEERAIWKVFARAYLQAINLLLLRELHQIEERHK